jgi:predicted AAA+ superfamily ATPase
MKRHAEQYLKHWLFKTNRKPLVIRGARQVGKSTTVRNFAKRNNLELVEINLERHNNLNNIFKTNNIPEICREIEFLTKKDLSSTKGKLLFLDEIQATPEAISCLRYFYEDLPELAVISAGSLLEFTLAKHHFSMPVGRIEYLHLGPMTFIEYLEAKGETKLVDLISNFSWDVPFPQTAHTQLCAYLRDFLIIGGMPEAVNNFIKTNSFDNVIDIHLSIIETYQDDFSKYARQSQLATIQNVFQHTPQAVGNKVKYSNIDPTVQSREIKTAINLLAKAKVISIVHHTSANGLPLKADINQKIYKLYFLDVGLMNTMCGTKYFSLETLQNNRFVNEGNAAEQFIAQHLLYAGRPNSNPELFYWLREKSSSNAEIDFIIPWQEKIIPVEVKSGKSGTLKSLYQFISQKEVKQCLRFDLNMPSKQTIQQKRKDHSLIDSELISIPIYMVNYCNINFKKES